MLMGGVVVVGGIAYATDAATDAADQGLVEAIVAAVRKQPWKKITPDPGQVGGHRFASKKALSSRRMLPGMDWNRNLISCVKWLDKDARPNTEMSCMHLHNNKDYVAFVQNTFKALALQHRTEREGTTAYP